MEGNEPEHHLWRRADNMVVVVVVVVVGGGETMLSVIDQQ